MSDAYWMQTVIYPVILAAHAASGTVVLICAAVAIATRMVALPHLWHVWAGRGFTLGMVGIGATGLLITVFNPSPFLLSLALFLLYLAVMGWRHAKARSGIGGTGDRLLIIMFVAGFLAMLGYGAWVAFGLENGMGYVVLVFGVIGLLQSVADLRSVYGTAPTGPARIAAHLTRMLGGTIGALTAFLLIQFETGSIWVWLGPTAILTPLLVIWSRKVKSGWLPPKAPAILSKRR